LIIIEEKLSLIGDHLLISPSSMRKWLRVAPSGVLHVGAHQAEELPMYRHAQFGRVIWVEAQDSLIAELREKVVGSDDLVYQAVAWSKTGVEKRFGVTNNGQSSSLFRLAEHLDYYPKIIESKSVIVTTERLDSVLPISESFDFLNFDIQGAELEALKGLGERLDQVKWAYLEVNKRMLYEGIPMVSEIDSFMETQGFRRLFTSWTGAGWGDALYARAEARLNLRLIVNLGVAVLAVSAFLRRYSPRVIMRRLRRNLYRRIDKLRGL
jgi:FkbM family methyltransferase